jgi:hypothetical protein
MSKRRRGPFHDGHVHVLADRCPTCIFRPGNLMTLEPGRVKDMVDACLRDPEGAGNIPCHETLDGRQAICRGFWDGYSDRLWLLRMAAVMGVVREVTLEELGHRPWTR